MKKLLFIDGSVHPQTKIGYGAYLLVEEQGESLTSFQERIQLKRFTETSSSRLEIQTCLWALEEIQPINQTVSVYTDSQTIIGLPARRARLEQNEYRSKQQKLLSNHDLYRAFFSLTDSLDCTFIKIQGHFPTMQKQGLDRIFALVDQAARYALRHQAKKP